MPIDSTSALVAAITDALYGEAVAGMTVAARIRYHFKQSTVTLARRLVRLERVNVTAEIDARRTAERALEAERTARTTAEQSADATADTLLGGV